MDAGDNVNGLRDVIAEALGVDYLLMRGAHIEVSAEILRLELEGVLGAIASSPLTAICSRKWAKPRLRRLVDRDQPDARSAFLTFVTS
jgi:hypothetical protein